MTTPPFEELALSDLASESYVLLTTFRKNGEGVSTPVWIAQSSDGQLLVTTGANSGKVKRILNDPRIELVACDARGGIRGTAAPVQAHAEIASDAETRALTDAALKAKYGLQFTAIRLANRLSALKNSAKKKKKSAEKSGAKHSGSVALRITVVSTEQRVDV
ncbi:PPOX class F420-dependent oxidoreductase [Microterricola viridarii]|uniref:PPOX class F420-dependent oxidoreductase n=1 Tax=Microterricola viridarii TaxID=412690 RepID=UPI0009EB6138|nr:PPOX class F420-dependent oxidoreductase [Microterricola viridarii]